MGRLILNCPNCLGYTERPVGKHDYRGPVDACEVCGPARAWLEQQFDIFCEVRT